MSKEELHQNIQELGIGGWWDNELSQTEKEKFNHTITETEGERGEGFFSTDRFHVEMIGEEFVTRSQSPGGYLATMSAFEKDPEVAIKIARKAKNLLDQTDLQKLEMREFTDLHFNYQNLIRQFYPRRDIIPGALEDAMSCCRSVIRISPEVIKDPKMRMPPDNELPSSIGYDQLAIIAEKQKNYAAAIKISRLADSQGWAGDWESRIQRCEKKIAKANK